MVSETYPPEVNGVARTIHMFVEGLRRRGHAIQLVRPRQNARDVPAAEPGFEELLKPGFAIPRYPQLKMGLPARQALERAWACRRPDIVHIATEGPLGWSALAAASTLRVPVATDFHTNFHAYSRHYGVGFLERAVGAYLRRFHNRAGCTMVPTAELAETLRQRNFQRLRVVGRGIDPSIFNPSRRSAALRREWGAIDSTVVALCVGRFAPEKNIPLVIEAFRAMRAARRDTQLVLVGDGPLAAELARLNMGCVIAGRRLDEDLAAHYASADVFLFPSTTETFGNVTLEAMASGLAVVAYDYAAAREHLRHGQSALLARFDDAADFIDQAERLAREPGRIRPLGAEAGRAGARITWDSIAQQFEAVLLDLVDRPVPASPAAEAA